MYIYNIIFIFQNYLVYGKKGEKNTFRHIIDLEALLDKKCLYEYNFNKFNLSWKLFLKNLC